MSQEGDCAKMPYKRSWSFLVEGGGTGRLKCVGDFGKIAGTLVLQRGNVAQRESVTGQRGETSQVTAERRTPVQLMTPGSIPTSADITPSFVHMMPPVALKTRYNYVVVGSKLRPWAAKRPRLGKADKCLASATL